MFNIILEKKIIYDNHPTGETTIQINIDPTIVELTVPLNVSVVINPNEEPERQLIYSDIEIVNHAPGAVALYIDSFQSNNLPFTNLITPEELPEGLEWSTLTIAETKQYFAIGLSGSLEDNDWVSDAMNPNCIWATKTLQKEKLGEVKGDSGVYLKLNTKHGPAFKDTMSFTFSVVFVADLETVGTDY